MPEPKPSSPSLLKAGISGVVIFALIFFAVITMNTGDLLWFWPIFKEAPVGIIVHCYGTDIEVKPGKPAFEAVTNAVNTSLTGNKRWDQLSMSEVTYQEYKTSPTMMVIELHYDPPVTIHSQYAFFKSVNWLIIPLDGRHAPTNAVFGLEGGYTDPGSYHVNSTAKIVTALLDQGICTKR
jgi:hypothetical protein